MPISWVKTMVYNVKICQRYRGFHCFLKWGYPIAGWKIKENPKIKSNRIGYSLMEVSIVMAVSSWMVYFMEHPTNNWMRTGSSPILGSKSDSSQKNHWSSSHDICQTYPQYILSHMLIMCGICTYMTGWFWTRANVGKYSSTMEHMGIIIIN